MSLSPTIADQISQAAMAFALGNSGGGSVDPAVLSAALSPIQAQLTTLEAQIQHNNNPPAVSPNITQPWNGKNILWLGTSIPAAGYPELVCTAMAANCYNKAMPSSMARVAHKDGSVIGIPWTLFNRGLMKTIAECNYIIANYNNSTGTPVGTAPTSWTASLPLPISGALGNAGVPPPTDMNAMYTGGLTYAQDILAGSYENRVLPFLSQVQTNSIGQTVGNGYNNGVLVGAVADLVVLDHGYNDNQCGINGTQQDTLSDFTTIPTTKNNRFYFLGALNLLIDKIMISNPKLSIAFSGHYENQQFPNIATAQLAIAADRCYPILKLWEKLGWSQNLNPATSIKIINQWLVTDQLHPTETDSKQHIANYLFPFLSSIY